MNERNSLTNLKVHNTSNKGADVLEVAILYSVHMTATILKRAMGCIQYFLIF